MKIRDLKNHLQEVLDNLENYDEEEDVASETNTFFLKGGRHYIAIPSIKGFVDLDYPIDEEECEWCCDTYSKSKMIHKGGRCVCEECFKYLSTNEEDFFEGEEE